MFKKYTSFPVNPLILVLSGALTGLSTVYPYLFLLLFALFPFFRLFEREYSYKDIIKGSFLFGVGFYGATYLWVWGVYPLEWIGIADTRISFIIVTFFWLLTAFSLSLTVVVRALIIKVLLIRHENSFALIVSGIWVVFEYLAAFSISLVWAGAQGVIGAHWAFGSLGYALAEIPVIRSLSALGGVYVLSFVAVFFVAIMYVLIFSQVEKRKIYELRYAAVIGSIFLMFIIVWYGAIYFVIPEGEKRNVLLMHTAHPSSLKRLTQEENRARAENTFIKMEEDIRTTDVLPDIVLFPESSAILNQTSREKVLDLLTFLAQRKNTLFLNPSNNEDSKENLISSVWYIRTQQGIMEIRSKEFLVPVGEYAPYFTRLFTGIPYIASWLEKTYQIHGYSKVLEEVPVFKEKEVGVLQCSEILSTVFYRKIAKDHMILANAASHAPFARPRIIRAQTLKMARIHASANDRFFIQSGNIAPSLIVTNTGALQSFDISKNTSVLRGEIRLRSFVTPYTRWGDWFIYFLLTTFLILLIPVFRERNLHAERELILTKTLNSKA